MKDVISVSATISATLLLIAGYALISLWPGVMIVIVLGLTWLVGQQRRLGWLNDLGFALLIIAAAVGIWWGAPAGWMLTGAARSSSAVAVGGGVGLGDRRRCFKHST
jgi:hypothetical protein